MTDPAAPAPPARAALVPDVPVALGKLVRRVLCGNPGMMTGPGTNTYLVGIDEVAVIDPGPDDPDHLDAVVAAGSGRIRWILCTHTHPDHAPGAAGLKERTGAEVLSFEDRDGRVCYRHLADGAETREARLWRQLTEHPADRVRAADRPDLHLHAFGVVAAAAGQCLERVAVARALDDDEPGSVDYRLHRVIVAGAQSRAQRGRSSVVDVWMNPDGMTNLPYARRVTSSVDPVVVRRRLAAQHLTGRDGGSAVAVVRRVLAVQAQDPQGFRLAIRSRTSGTTATEAEAALDDGSLVVGWLNRGTLHLVAAEDYWWLHRLTTPQLETSNRRRLAQEGVSPAQAECGIEIVRASGHDHRGS